ncbi:hypothetical protein H0H93_011190 [Arthromyces matolae]|nr:hypothetical protein H0H93_011190 [Arthromyces matolae]
MSADINPDTVLEGEKVLKKRMRCAMTTGSRKPENQRNDARATKKGRWTTARDDDMPDLIDPEDRLLERDTASIERYQAEMAELQRNAPLKCHLCLSSPSTRCYKSDPDRTWRIRQGLLVMRLESISNDSPYFTSFTDLLGRRGFVCQFCLKDAWWDAFCQHVTSFNAPNDWAKDYLMKGDGFNQFLDTLESKQVVDHPFLMTYDIMCPYSRKVQVKKSR